MEASHSCQMCGTCVRHVRDPIWAINTQTQDLSPGIVLLILDLMFPTMWEYNTLKVAINIFVLISGVPSSLSLTLPYNIQNAKKILRFCVMKIFQNWCENLLGQLVCLGLTVSARLQVSSMRTLLRNVGLTFWSAIVFPLSRPVTDTRVEHLAGNIKTDQIRNKQIIKSFS